MKNYYKHFQEDIAKLMSLAVVGAVGMLLNASILLYTQWLGFSSVSSLIAAFIVVTSYKYLAVNKYVFVGNKVNTVQAGQFTILTLSYAGVYSLIVLSLLSYLPLVVASTVTILTIFPIYYQFCKYLWKTP